jgi:hypothetical protein
MMSIVQYVRTQIYLEPEQHRFLKGEAHRRGVSLAHLLRQLVDEATGARRAGGDLTRIVGLGHSGGGDIAHYEDDYVAHAVEQRDRRRAGRNHDTG